MNNFIENNHSLSLLQDWFNFKLPEEVQTYTFLERIIKYYTKFSIEDLKVKSRKEDKVRAKKIYSYLLVNRLGMSQTDVATLFNMNPSSVNYYINNFEDFLKGDLVLKQLYNNIIKELNEI